MRGPDLKLLAPHNLFRKFFILTKIIFECKEMKLKDLFLISMFSTLILYGYLWYLYLSGNRYNLTLSTIYNITFTALIAFFTIIQAVIAMLQFSFSQERSKPNLFAKLENGRTLMIENAGGGPAWKCEIVVRNKDNNAEPKEIKKDYSIIYPRGQQQIQIPTTWSKTPDFKVTIKYLEEEKKKEFKEKSYEFKAKFRKGQIAVG